MNELERQSFKEDLTVILNKYFHKQPTELDINDFLDVFTIGYNIKFKKEIDNYKEHMREHDEYMKELEENNYTTIN